MTALAFALHRKPISRPARSTDAPKHAGLWLAALVVGMLLAVFGLAARSGR